MSTQDRKLVELSPSLHEELKQAAEERKMPAKRLLKLLLGFALRQLKEGGLEVVEKVELIER